MSDTRNPFEEAMRTTESEGDPFAQSTADPFGSFPAAKTVIPAESEPIPESTPANSGAALNLGSQTASNPFETPAAPSAGTPNAEPPAKPVIDLGSQSGTLLPFSDAANSAVPASGGTGSQLRLLSSEPEESDDSDEDESAGDEPADVENPLAAAMSGTNIKSRKSKKRANGEGTFYQLEDKSWVHQITLGRKADGKPDRKTFAGRTRSVCIERREAYIAQKERIKTQLQEEQTARAALLLEAEQKGHSLESEVLFGDAFPHWLKLFKSPPTKKATTYTGYLNTYAVHFKEYFGERMMHEITQDVIQEYYNVKQLSGSLRNGKPGGLSAKTLRNHHMLLKDFFTYAVKKYTLKDNPALGTDRPAVQTPKMRVMTPDEMIVFLKEVVRETQRVAILFDLFTGLRVGELLALEVSDINLETQSVEINRNIIRVSTEAIALNNPNIRVINYSPDKKTHLIVQETPKTDTSARSIPLSDELFELIAKHLFFLDQSGWPNPNNLLFPSKSGTHIDPKSYEKRLVAISQRCGIKKVNPHALRHTFATKLVEENVPLTTVQELMGHTSVSTTQRYVTTLFAEKRKAVDSMSGYLNPESLISVKKLNGTKHKMRFEDVRLPSWLQREPEAAQI